MLLLIQSLVESVFDKADATWYFYFNGDMGTYRAGNIDDAKKIAESFYKNKLQNALEEIK